MLMVVKCILLDNLVDGSTRHVFQKYALLVPCKNVGIDGNERNSQLL